MEGGKTVYHNIKATQVTVVYPPQGSKIMMRWLTKGDRMILKYQFIGSQNRVYHGNM